jgi:hypothetical protein
LDPSDQIQIEWLLPYVRSTKEVCCPLNGRPYRPFSLCVGVECDNGHHLSAMFLDDFRKNNKVALALRRKKAFSREPGPESFVALRAIQIGRTGAVVRIRHSGYAEEFWVSPGENVHGVELVEVDLDGRHALLRLGTNVYRCSVWDRVEIKDRERPHVSPSDK